MNPLTTTPPELVLPLVRTETVARLAAPRPHARSLRRAIGRAMVTWGARLAPPEPVRTPARCRVGATPA